MNKNIIIAISVALVIIGIVLVIWGLRAEDSLSSDVSRFFTGSPTDRAIWLLVCGIAAAVLGLSGLVFGVLPRARA